MPATDSKSWVFTPEGPSTHKYFRKLNNVKRMLQAKGITPQTAVYVTEIIDEFDQNGHSPRMCDVYGWIAADRITQGSHRLATDEEIANCLAEQLQRADGCAAQEAMNRREGTLRISQAFTEAVRRLGPNPEK